MTEGAKKRTDQICHGPVLVAGHQGWVRGAAFSGDGQSLVTADEERKIIFWDMLTRKPKQELNSGVQIYAVTMSPTADQFAFRFVVA